MLDFILVPLVVGICVAGTYGLFELFARRKERLAIIEKIGEKLDATAFVERDPHRLTGLFAKLSFGSLKVGCLLVGTGLGLLVGFFLNIHVLRMGFYAEEMAGWYRNNLTEMAYGSSVLLFGGIGLIIAFIIELKMGKKREGE